MSLGWRTGVFVLVFVAAVVWVAASGGEHATMVRHFLRNLLRQLL